jgi:hypothetical protein
VFLQKNAAILSEDYPYDCAIDLEEQAELLFGPIYLSQKQLAKLRKYIDENLAKKFIHHSKSLVGAPILFANKENSSLRMCMEYRGLYKVTKNKCYIYVFDLWNFGTTRECKDLYQD